MPTWYRRELDYGAEGADVEVVQRKLGATVNGLYDVDTAAAVRGLQRRRALTPTGIVDEGTAAVLGEAAAAGLTPLWFTRELHLGLAGPDVALLRDRLGLAPGNRFDRETEAAVRRYQSGRAIAPTGAITESLAVQIGE